MAAKPILGEGFPPYVREQVKVRQEKLGEDPITTGSILKNDGKTAWIKLASSIDLDSNAQKELAVTANFPEDVQENNYAARSLILYNGTSNSFFSNEQPAGVRGPYTWTGDIFSTSTDNLLGQATVSLEGGAYGFGGFQQGAVPMPGIMDFKVVPKNRGGIRDATINIRANNIRQFQLLESLYLRLGYHVLIEWGWTNYYTNDGKLTTRNDIDSPVLDSFLGNGSDPEYYNILRKISQEKERSNGNYDAMLGKVVNFTWKLIEGGKYDISIRVLSAGDIIDSLKLPNLPTNEIAIINNQLGQLDGRVDSDPDAISANELVLMPEATKSTLHRWLWLIDHIIVPNQDEKGERFQGTAQGIRNFRDFYMDVYQKDFGVRPDMSQWYNTGDNVFTTQYAYLQNLIPGEQEYTNRVPTSFGGAKVPRIGAWYASFRTENSGDIKEGYKQDYYIKFGTLLAFISKTLLYYNQNTSQPVVDIDFDLDTNFCYTFPIVPGVCDLTTLSVNDNICLVNAYVNFTSGIKSLWPNIFPLQDSKFNQGADKSHGRTMAISLHMGFIKDCADAAYDNQDHTINLQKFLDAILDGINSCFYGTINLVTQINPDTNVLYILDLSQLPDIDSLGVDTTLTKFRVSGFNLGEASFMRDISITSEISKNIANQLTIGAQQSGNVISNIPTGLTKFNVGYTDRVFEKKLDSYQTNKAVQAAQAAANTQQAAQQAALEEQKSVASIKLWLRQWALLSQYLGYAVKDRLPTDTASAKYYDVIEPIIKWMLSQITSDLPTLTSEGGEVTVQGQNPPGYIPISLNLTMEGLSGMKLFNRFTISEEYLPFSYRNHFDFIIKGITHELKNNYWETMIESLCVPKPRNVIANSTGGIEETQPPPSGSSSSNGACATDPNDNFGRLVGSEADIPVPFNKKYTTTWNKNTIYSIFRLAGFTHTQAAVALANAQAESNFNNLAIGDSCQSYGLFQTHTTRGVAKEALNGRYINTLIAKWENRYAFFNPYVNTLVILDQAFRSNLMASTDIASATVNFVDRIERPNDREGAKLTRSRYATTFDSSFRITKADIENILNDMKTWTAVTPGGSSKNFIEILSQLIYYWGYTAQTRQNVTAKGTDASVIRDLRKTYMRTQFPNG